LVLSRALRSTEPLAVAGAAAVVAARAEPQSARLDPAAS
jgi:hypothetical protein